MSSLVQVAQDVVERGETSMKKLNSTNSYLAGFEYHSDGKLSVYCTSDKIFKILLHKLFLFSDAADSGTIKTPREFTYISDAQLLSVTFGENVVQPINFLADYHFITADEKTAMQSNYEKKKYKYSSVLDCLKVNKKKRASEPESEESQILLKKE